MHIVYVSDGKAGHRSQALGLYQAMCRQSAAEVTFEEISVEQLSVFSVLLALLKRNTGVLAKPPDYLFGVGSHTQLRVLLLGKIYPNAETVIMMKPNFPLTWFDCAVIPEHDGVEASAHVISTKGALNPIVDEQRHQKNRVLIALGGSSKRHQWNADKVLTAIKEIVRLNPQAEMILTTSRRTPKEFLAALKAENFVSHIRIFPVEQTPQGWIFEQMQQAEAVWVTEDSVSMVYEALTAGCRVGVILIDRLKQDRITQSIDALLQQQTVSASSDLNQLPSIHNFQEADRVAQKLCTRSPSSGN